MRRATSVVFSALAALAAAALPAQEGGSGDKAAELLEEYCRRAAAVAPLDAEQHYELASWCEENGLSSEARRYFEETIAIDRDHAAARAALGYVRYGTGWALSSELAARARARPRDAAGGEGAASNVERPPEETGQAAASSRRSPSAAVAPQPAAVKPEEGSSAAGTTADAIASELERKRAWAAQVAEKLRQDLQTHEDDDFLVHTTLPSLRHAKVAQLIASLKAGKKLVTGFLGVRGSDARLWPSKVQFLLLRSEEQYLQFAELIDGVTYAKNPEGGYSHEDRTVLWRPDSPIVLRRLAETCLEKLYGSDRWLSWWLEEGIAEEIICLARLENPASEEEKQEFANNFKTTAALLSAEQESVTIYTLLESRSPERNRASQASALAMTLVHFLSEVSRRGFQDFLRDLKGDQAPAPPAPDDEEAQKTFWLNFFAYQEKALESRFRKSTEDLGRLWKKYVLETAEKLAVAPEPARGPRGRNRQP